MTGPEPKVDGAAAADDAEENFSDAPVANITTPCQNPPTNGERLVAAATQKQAALMNPDSPQYQSNSARGPVLSAVMDPQSGDIFYGQNKDTPPADLHPQLQARLDARNNWLGQQPQPLPIDIQRSGVAGTHSEIYALDQALKARQQRTGQPIDTPEKLNQAMGEMLLHNRSLNKKRPDGRPPRCAHCRNLTDGATTHDIDE